MQIYVFKLYLCVCVCVWENVYFLLQTWDQDNVNIFHSHSSVLHFEEGFVSNLEFTDSNARVNKSKGLPAYFPDAELTCTTKLDFCVDYEA